MGRLYDCTRKIQAYHTTCTELGDAIDDKRYNATTISKLRSAYNKCIKIFLGFRRRDSMTNVLFQLGLPSFDTIIHNASFSFLRQSSMCNNRLVKHLLALRC